MKAEAQAFFSAVQFLTRLPTPGWTGWEAGRLDRAMPHFVLVGGIIGALCGAVYLIASMALTPPVAALLALGAGIVTTGALHEDGLADFADGLGTHDPVRALAIMKDSHVGAFGVIALIVVLLLKGAALATMPPLFGAAALIGAHGLSRAWLYPTIKSLPYARDEKDAKVPPISRTIVTSPHRRPARHVLRVDGSGAGPRPPVRRCRAPVSGHPRQCPLCGQ